MKTVGVFVDVKNLYYVVGKKFEGRKLNYRKYLEKALGSDVLYRAFAYGFYLNDQVRPFISSLRGAGFEPKFVETYSTKAYLSLNMPLAMDIVRCIDKLDTVILGSSDNNIGELINWIKERGVKCEVFSCCIPTVIREACDNWIDISEDELEEKVAEEIASS